MAVANATAEAKAAADFVTRAAGGHGAVREVIEMILKAQGKWDVHYCRLSRMISEQRVIKDRKQ